MTVRPRKLYSAAAERQFEERYGRRGKLVWGETMNKVAREQVASSPSGVKIEHVRAHTETNAQGTEFLVRAHTVQIRAHPHRRGEHPGRCTAACRAGRTPHLERRRRRGRR